MLYNMIHRDDINRLLYKVRLLKLFFKDLYVANLFCFLGCSRRKLKPYSSSFWIALCQKP